MVEWYSRHGTRTLLRPKRFLAVYRTRGGVSYKRGCNREWKNCPLTYDIIRHHTLKQKIIYENQDQQNRAIFNDSVPKQNSVTQGQRQWDQHNVPRANKGSRRLKGEASPESYYKLFAEGRRTRIGFVVLAVLCEFRFLSILQLFSRK
jgi:hypothetical protein